MTIIHHGNCLDVMREMADNSVDSIVTDPPYGLNFMGKKWDYDVPSTEIWAECLRVLKPGGHLLAFAGTRTQHRMAVRIEDAGFEIRDMIAWVYGSGFPKSLDVSKAIDKAAGAERERVACAAFGAGGNFNDDGGTTYGTRLADGAATDAGRQWEGWGTALKPALEPITMARKPLIGTVAANVQAHGTGGLNIDGCRVGDGGGTSRSGQAEYPKRADGTEDRSGSWARTGHDIVELGAGRWPANLIHSGCDEVLASFPSAPGQLGPISSSAPSEKTSNVYGRMSREGEASAGSENGGDVGFKMRPGARRLDAGSSARFFYCAKASKADRNDGCDGLPLRASGMVSNTSGQHITRRDGGAPLPTANNHPTVKPTELMRYLCRLVTPPGGLVLDPFAGSGSTGRGAVAEGFRFVGIEMDENYVEIARARIRAMQPGLSLEAA